MEQIKQWLENFEEPTGSIIEDLVNLDQLKYLINDEVDKVSVYATKELVEIDITDNNGCLYDSIETGATGTEEEAFIKLAKALVGGLLD